jgi:hypothetical protein
LLSSFNSTKHDTAKLNWGICNQTVTRIKMTKTRQKSIFVEL